MNTKFKDVDEYIASFAPEVQERLQIIRAIIKNSSPDVGEKISYGMPTYFLKKNMLHFAAFKNHIGLFALPSENAFTEDELEQFKTGKGSIQFPSDKELPLEMITKIVRLRLEEMR